MPCIIYKIIYVKVVHSSKFLHIYCSLNNSDFVLQHIDMIEIYIE